MTKSLVTGGCLCGAVRYEYDGEVGPAAYCHCADCRRVSGGPFTVSVRMNREQFRLVRGEVKRFVSLSDAGSEVARCFCPECGTPIYGYRPHHGDRLFVKAGTLDDPTLVHPSDQFWTRSAVDWAHIPADLPAFDRGRA
jgi:hypothetical protein